MVRKTQNRNPQLKNNNSAAQVAVPLRRNINIESIDYRTNSWFSGIEDVVQSTIQSLRKRTKNDLYLSGVRDLESALFSKSLITTRSNWHQIYEGRGIPLEFEIFSKPVGLISFQVHNRKYSCIKYKVDEDLSRSSAPHKYEAALHSLEKVFSSNRVEIKEEPTTKELMGILIDHLSEDLHKNEKVFKNIGEFVIGEMLRPRRSAIRDWQDRLEQYVTEKYDHDDDKFFFYTYPIVDMLIEDGKYLTLLFVSPLDKNFVDEKVSIYHQCAEITIGIFDVENINYSRCLEPVAQQIKQAYGRVLFTNMHEEASRALTATFDDQSRILRHWVSMAAKGYDGLIENELAKGIFDSDEFIQAIVKQVLCADIPNVESEVYPFDRVFIFREAGSSSSKSSEEPIEVTVMEASILSTNPADRNQYLTAPEMRIRTTEDFERNASSKIVKDQDIIKFYMHSHGNEIVFSRKAKLTKTDADEIDNPQVSSIWNGSASQRFFKIIPLKEDGDNELSHMFSNLLGRLLVGNFAKKTTFSPLTGEKLFVTETFTKDFERKRLDATEKFDARGLYYRYNHGIQLVEEIPLLYRMQEAYFAFLEEIFKERNLQHVKDRYKQDNLSKEEMRKVLEEHKAIDKQSRKRRMEGMIDEVSAISKQASKVVYIAFSWELHDENMDILRGRQSDEVDDDDDYLSEEALLGEEYTYTVICISDIDREKSMSQLNSERENLHLFFKLIMDRIWIDKKFEMEKLNNRSKMIVGSLSQFAHRAKSFISNEEHENYLDQELDKLKDFTSAKGTTAKLIEFNGPDWFFGKLLRVPNRNRMTEVDVEENIRSWLNAVFTNSPRDIGRLNLSINYNHIPELKIRWSRSIVKEAFDNVIKNACEAALDDDRTDGEPVVSIQLQAIPRNEYSSGHWFFDIVVENTGGPIPIARLKLLNSLNPRPLSESDKPGSTGLGIYLSRFQLINDIGSGANIIYTNLENGNVQVRLRLPATMIESTVEERVSYKPSHPINKDYILYVEDHPARYKEAEPELQALVSGAQIDVRHKKSLSGALSVIKTKMPLAIFTDYNIFPDEEGGDNANSKHGKELLINILKESNDAKRFPPIWIMTEEKESGILKGLKDEEINLTDYGYRLVPETEQDIKNLIQPGTLVVFSGEKNPTRIPNFEVVIDYLANLENAAHEIEELESHVENVIRFDFSDKGLKKLEKKYSDLIENKASGVFFGKNSISNVSNLYESLRIWFAGPKLPDFDLAVSVGIKKLKPIRSHYDHDKILLNLEADLALYNQIPVELIYWGFSQNVLISSKGFTAKDAVRGWKSIKHDDRGPLAKFRHDMKNELYGEKYDKFRIELQSEIDKAEAILKNHTYDFQILEESLTSQSEKPDVILTYLSTARPIEEARVRLEAIFLSIAEILGSIKEQTGSPVGAIEKFREMGFHLRQFLGVR